MRCGHDGEVKELEFAQRNKEIQTKRNRIGYIMTYFDTFSGRKYIFCSTCVVFFSWSFCWELLKNWTWKLCCLQRGVEFHSWVSNLNLFRRIQFCVRAYFSKKDTPYTDWTCCLFARPVATNFCSLSLWQQLWTPGMVRILGSCLYWMSHTPKIPKISQPLPHWKLAFS